MNLLEVVSFAQRMSKAEDVSFSTEVTITCEVDITMSNRTEEGVTVVLSFPAFDGISLAASVEAEYVALPSSEELNEHNKRVDETGEGSFGLPVRSVPVTLSAEEVCKIFHIPDTAEWKMSNHGTFLGEVEED